MDHWADAVVLPIFFACSHANEISWILWMLGLTRWGGPYSMFLAAEQQKSCKSRDFFPAARDVVNHWADAVVLPIFFACSQASEIL